AGNTTTYTYGHRDLMTRQVSPASANAPGRRARLHFTIEGVEIPVTAPGVRDPGPTTRSAIGSPKRGIMRNNIAPILVTFCMLSCVTGHEHQQGYDYLY